MAARCRAPDRLMRVNACGEEAGKMAESGEDLRMAVRPEGANHQWRRVPPG